LTSHGHIRDLLACLRQRFRHGGRISLVGVRHRHRHHRAGVQIHGMLRLCGPDLKKALVVVAAQEDGPGIGRIRMCQIVDASAESLAPFVLDSVVTGSVVHTDGWPGYLPLEKNGYDHEVTVLRSKKKTPSELLPRVHRVISLLKRWLMGTHQGAVSQKHLDYYLDEFTFRFNRRRSKSRGKLFFRLVQQAVAVEPVPLDRILHPEAKAKTKPQPVVAT
jgi:transposase-like protein